MASSFGCPRFVCMSSINFVRSDSGTHNCIHESSGIFLFSLILYTTPYFVTYLSAVSSTCLRSGQVGTTPSSQYSAIILRSVSILCLFARSLQMSSLRVPTGVSRTTLRSLFVVAGSYSLTLTSVLLLSLLSFTVIVCLAIFAPPFRMKASSPCSIGPSSCWILPPSSMLFTSF